jgi:uroporphyrin-III C-methyltransferase/precorrin-2 dehydrogenase/sirohydrochlorin ferrochelatase
MASMNEPTPYLSGLILRDRRVVVVGGGHVAQRRVPVLIAAGANVTVVSPEVTPALEGMGGEIDLVLRRFEPGDLDGAWYVIAATDDHAANARGGGGAAHLLRPQRRRDRGDGLDARGRPARHGDHRGAGQP